MNERHDHLEPLSADGEARRDAMLGPLRGEVARSAKRRRIKRRTAWGAKIVAPLVVILGIINRSNNTPAPISPPEDVQQAAAPGWEAVETDPAAAARITMRSRTDWAGVIVNDDELLLELEEMGRPAGLIRMGGKAWISGVTPAEPEAPRGS